MQMHKRDSKGVAAQRHKGGGRGAQVEAQWLRHNGTRTGAGRRGADAKAEVRGRGDKNRGK
eukprot:4912040-Pleurochrysis_carterae.AAC.11